jgi:hypothetical protein
MSTPTQPRSKSTAATFLRVHGVQIRTITSVGRLRTGRRGSILDHKEFMWERMVEGWLHVSRERRSVVQVVRLGNSACLSYDLMCFTLM